MKTLKTVGLIGAMLVGASTLALAQTSSTTTMPGASTSTTVTPPAGGSHPQTGTSTTAPSTRSPMGAATNGVPGPQTAMISSQDVKKRLESAGYSSVTDIKPNKGGYTARAMKGGKKVTVDVDGNGKIAAMK